jgi:hypothetical protein
MAVEEIALGKVLSRVIVRAKMEKFRATGTVDLPNGLVNEKAEEEPAKEEP